MMNDKIKKIIQKLLEPYQNGETLNETQGGGDPFLVAETWSSLILSNINIPPNSLILDYGCGVGRLALGLMSYRPDLRYVGVDIVPKFIEFASTNITPINEKFTFHLIEDDNPLYKKYSDNNQKNINLTKFNEEIYQKRFDFVFALSLFTHLPPSNASQIISKISSLTHDESIFLMSAFVIDGEADRSIKNETSFPFSKRTTKYKSGYLEDIYNGENSAIGFTPLELDIFSKTHGFTLTKQLNGFWRGAPARKRQSLQDVLVYEKQVYLPENFNSEIYISKNHDVKNSGMSANFHYLAFGKDENRLINSQEQ